MINIITDIPHFYLNKISLFLIETVLKNIELIFSYYNEIFILNMNQSLFGIRKYYGNLIKFCRIFHKVEVLSESFVYCQLLVKGKSWMC